MNTPRSNAHPTQQHPRWPMPGNLSPAPQPDRTRSILILLAAVLATALLVVVVFVSALLVTRGGPPSSSNQASTVTVSGAVVLQSGQFEFYGGIDSPTCQAGPGFTDISRGVQVTVTDSGGRVLGTGTLERGVSSDPTTMSDGTRRATSCMFRFAVPDIRRHAGPYGVEVARRGMVHVDEGQLGSVRLGF